MTEDQIKALTSEQATTAIAKYVEEAYAAIAKAEAIADAHHQDFYFEPAYGMGGRYVGDPEAQETGRRWGTINYGSNWAPSSQSC